MQMMFYNQLTTELTNRVMAGAAVAIRASSLLVPGNNNKQKLSHKIDNTYQINDKYNNQPEIYNNDQEQPNKQQIA